jgi:hypothetical protein
MVTKKIRLHRLAMLQQETVGDYSATDGVVTHL